MKNILALFFFFVCGESFSYEKDNLFRAKLNSLKKQTVSMHNQILENNKDLENIKLDIEKNKQEQIIFKKYIKDKEELAKRLVFLLQEKHYVTRFSHFAKNLNNESDDFVTKRLVREFYFQKTKKNINNFFVGLKSVEELELELEEKLKSFEEKKIKLKTKQKDLENKLAQVLTLQKKIKTNPSFKIKEKILKKKAKNLNDLVKGVGTKKKIIRSSKTNFQMPVQGKIISDFGEGKQVDVKYGLVIKASNDSFVTSPTDGLVVYAEQFKTYGNLVIIKNDNNFLSVLSGMQNILISSGNKVLKGEPIARVSSEFDNKIYFELRYKGKVIDPKSKVEIL